MRTGDMQCLECHGDMVAVGGKHPLLPGGSLDGTNDGNPRRPWTNLPRCQSCHTSDALDRLTGSDLVEAADGIRLLQAYRKNDDSASPILASNKRFAENNGTLFRFSRGHGTDLLGTVLSRTARARSFVDEHGQPVQYQKGDVVSCDRCHSLPTPD